MAYIVGLQYLPPVAWFAHWMQHGSAILESHEHFQKRSWRNRTAILSPGKPTLLTVPLQKGKHQQLPIREVKIAYYEPWMHHHIHALQSAYGRTAFAEEVLPPVFECILQQHDTLWTLNESLLQQIISLLPGAWQYAYSESYQPVYDPEVTDLRRGVPAGQVEDQHDSVPVYPQVQRLHQSFQANLTILDVLCHLGPGAADYISRFKANLYAHT